MRRTVAGFVLLSATAAPHASTVAAEPGVPGLRQAVIEVVNATGGELRSPRPGLLEEMARLAGAGTGSKFSVADAFAASAATALQKKGVSAVAGPRPDLPTFRIELVDFEIRNQDTAAAVAFVSAKYRLTDPPHATLWEAEQKRLSIRLGGPDLTRSELARIAAEAVGRALSSFPLSNGGGQPGPAHVR